MTTSTLTDRAVCTAGAYLPGFLPGFLGVLLREPNGLARVPEVRFFGAVVDGPWALLGEGVVEAEAGDVDLGRGELLMAALSLDGPPDDKALACGFDLGRPRVAALRGSRFALTDLLLIGMTTSIIIFCFRMRWTGLCARGVDTSGRWSTSAAEFSPATSVVEALPGLATE